MTAQLDVETLRWAAKAIRRRQELCRSLGYNEAAIAAFEEAWVIIAAAASRVSVGKSPDPTSEID